MRQAGCTQGGNHEKEDYVDRIEKIKQRLEKLDKKLGVDKNE